MSDDPLEDQLRRDAANWRAAGGSGTPEQHERLMNSALHRARTRRLPPMTLVAAAAAAVIVVAVVGVAVQTSSDGIGPGPAGTSGAPPRPDSTCTAPPGQIEKREPMTPSQTRRAASAVLIGAAATLTACSSSSSNQPSTPPPTSSSASRAAAPHPSTTTPTVPSTPSATANQPAAPPTTSVTERRTPPAKASSSSSSSQSTTCTTSNLKLVKGTGLGAGGTGYQPYYLKNVGSLRCSIYGYPGFSTLGKSGQIVGHPAERDPNLNERPDGGPQYKETTLKLKPGQRAEFVVAASGCQNEKNPKYFTIAEIQVYPPDQTQSIREPAPGQGCGTSEVGYVIPAS